MRRRPAIRSRGVHGGDPDLRTILNASVLRAYASGRRSSVTSWVDVTPSALVLTSVWCHYDVMYLERYVEELRKQLGAAAVGGDESTRLVAERLSTALEPAARLVLLEALSDAASEITRDLTPGSVDVRLRGRDPEFVVSRPAAPDLDIEQPADAPSRTTPSDDGVDRGDDTTTTRTTLRLPDHLKSRVERAAADDGLSVNTWLVRVVAGALEPRVRRAAQRDNRLGDSFTGWVR